LRCLPLLRLKSEAAVIDLCYVISQTAAVKSINYGESVYQLPSSEALQNFNQLASEKEHRDPKILTYKVKINSHTIVGENYCGTMHGFVSSVFPSVFFLLYSSVDLPTS
jgi:hypothetical protein